MLTYNLYVENCFLEIITTLLFKFVEVTEKSAFYTVRDLRGKCNRAFYYAGQQSGYLVIINYHCLDFLPESYEYSLEGYLIVEYTFCDNFLCL